MASDTNTERTAMTTTRYIEIEEFGYLPELEDAGDAQELFDVVCDYFGTDIQQGVQVVNVDISPAITRQSPHFILIEMEVGA